jgi:hypothetical protein
MIQFITTFFDDYRITSPRGASPMRLGNAQQLLRQSTHEPCPIRHADAGRHPRLSLMREAKSWMPTCVGMTGENGSAHHQSIRSLLGVA